ncbi:alpha-galactosidase [Pseudobutyrivibrio sp. YE44]|uniref:alpha-galactosidase n=1 Tax=Pseudobutyrivibrio sp. YE44 TaxID=1520802 RepID=UPI000883C9A9|nr:alpha-galactosidase [Pseudobutyrivibrio sp. YE44]SDB06283.1 alpha-galactosidase [Pseudobutyrivibrio sp. YE44]
MIRTFENKVFLLNTNNTSYAFKVMETGQLEHLYYGSLINEEEPWNLAEKRAFAPGNTVTYNPEHPELTLEDVRLEMSALGKGDYREPMVEVVCQDGSSTLDFVYDSYEIIAGKPELKTLPSSYYEIGNVETLNITLKDKNHGFTLVLSYSVFADCDVITRTAKFINTSDATVKLTRMMSLLMDFDQAGMKITSFHGSWTREMNKSDMILPAGKYVNSSFTGTSSNRTNPLFIISEADSSETAGEVFGFNLLYSGNHYSATEVSPWNKTRVVYGINPQNFSWTLEPSDEFEAPEAVMTFSGQGFRQMSLNMHDFVREHITRGSWKDKERPILINSWEASYFDFTESSLVKLAKTAKNTGVELFVMDDGWFGQRNDDKHALGDWDIVNTKKLPGGLAGLSKKINDLGLMFGLWVEPEMINVDSELYKKHPEWAIDIPGMDHAEGRNQRLLDLCNPEVVDYMIERMSEVFSTPGLSYIKWDMNRTFSDYYSKYLPAEKQQEVGHRYVLGFYRMLKTLAERFPEILMEGCAAGGNRFDLGALCYFPQIWGSDNTDAASRLVIQNGYSYGYPQSTYTAHVSACPNHQTLRVTPLESRFAVASFGVLGYELNLNDAKSEDIAAVKAQIELYKEYRRALQFGDFYRHMDGNIYEWSIVSKDKATAVTMLMQKEIKAGEQYLRIKQAGLDEASKYHFFGRKLEYNLKGFGDLVNTVAPVHVKQDGLLHNVIAKFVKMPGECEDFVASGSTLNNAGVKLAQSFVGTGYNENVRYFPDFGARLYFTEKL